MARYIDADKMIDGYSTTFPYDLCYCDEGDLMEWLNNQPTADVVPKSEVDNLEYTLMGVMHSVDKWLEGDELKQNEVNRAITMREKTLRIIENAKTEVAREIFEEIERLYLHPTNEYDLRRYENLKKKYTEVKNND